MENKLKNIKKFGKDLVVYEIENYLNKYKNSDNGCVNQKLLLQDITEINKRFGFLEIILNETKFNFEYIDFKVKCILEFLKSDIKIFEEKYSIYNSTIFHQKINDYQVKFQDVKDIESSRNAAQLYFRNEYEKTISIPHFSIKILQPDCKITANLTEQFQYSESEIIAFYKILDRYKRGFDALISNNQLDIINASYASNMASSAKDSFDNRLRFKPIDGNTIIKNHLAKIDRKRVKILIDEINEIKIDFNIEDYFNTLVEAEYWIGISKLHPNILEIENIATEYKAVVSICGTLENYRDQINENRKKNIHKSSPNQSSSSRQ